MIQFIMIALGVGIFAGVSWTNYKWVRACRNGYVMSVDGCLYSIHKVEPDIDKLKARMQEKIDVS